VLLVLLVGSLVGPRDVDAEECGRGDSSCCCCEERHDDIWVISTRCAPCCIDDREAANPTLSFERYDAANDVWRDATAEEFFHGSDAILPTTIWVHGDRIKDGEEYEVGMTVYDRLVECQSVERIRFVIWSWPASVIYTLRPLKDARAKGDISLTDGYRLGWVLAHMPTETRVSFLGYSAAGRIIGGAINGMAGGLVAGRPLLVEGRAMDEDPAPGRPLYSVVTFATAIDNYWLEPGELFGLAPSQVERWLLMNNYCDKILQHYPKLDGTDALGFTGIPNLSALGEYSDRFVEFDAGDYIGREHRWRDYVGSETLMSLMREYCLPPPEGFESTGRNAGSPVQTIADAGDVEIVDGRQVVVDESWRLEMVERTADSGEIDLVDGVPVVIEDGFLGQEQNHVQFTSAGN